MSHSEPVTATDPLEPNQHFHWRRLFQFRLRSLMILMTICTVWIGMWSHKARQQRDAITWLRRMGPVNFDYDFEVQERTGPRCWPTWLVNALGIDYFASVQSVTLLGPPEVDAGLKHVEGLTTLQSLEIIDTFVTDADLEHLKGLTALKRLEITASVFTRADTEHIEIGQTQLSDAGLAHLKGHVALESLNLRGTQVTDGGLAHLKGLTKLTWLDLDKTRVTDNGLVHLQGLTRLKALFLSDTQVTAAGVDRLKQSLPNCRVFR